MGSFTGLSSSAYALGALPLPAFDQPDLVDFLLDDPAGGGDRARHRASSSARPGRSCRSWSAARSSRCPVAGLVDRRAGDRLRRDDRQGRRRGAVLRAGPAARGSSRTPGAGRSGRSRCSSCFKGIGYAISLGRLPRRPDLPRDVPRRRRRPHGGRSSPASTTTPAVAVGIGAAVVAVLRIRSRRSSLAVAADVERRRAGLAAHHRRRGRRLHHHDAVSPKRISSGSSSSGVNSAEQLGDDRRALPVGRRHDADRVLDVGIDERDRAQALGQRVRGEPGVGGDAGQAGARVGDSVETEFVSTAGSGVAPASAKAASTIRRCCMSGVSRQSGSVAASRQDDAPARRGTGRPRRRRAGSARATAAARRRRQRLVVEVGETRVELAVREPVAIWREVIDCSRIAHARVALAEAAR